MILPNLLWKVYRCWSIFPEPRPPHCRHCPSWRSEWWAGRWGSWEGRARPHTRATAHRGGGDCTGTALRSAQQSIYSFSLPDFHTQSWREGLISVASEKLDGGYKEEGLAPQNNCGMYIFMRRFRYEFPHPYQEYDVKYRETLEDIGKTGFQVDGFVIKYKQTSYISWTEINITEITRYIDPYSYQWCQILIL